MTREASFVKRDDAGEAHGMKTSERGAPASLDAVIEAYKRGIDRSLIRESLKLTVEQRFERLMRLQHFAAELRKAGRRATHDRL